jgi:peptidoglycan endopeptidase LytE
VFTTAALGQNGDTRSRIVARTLESSAPAIHDEDTAIIEFASSEELRSAQPQPEKRLEGLQFRQLVQTAIDERLGARYHWGSTGPNVFDCSGFVWSTFQSAGITFERASARTLWSRFLAPPTAEQYKFGTLVFFSNLQHVGIVADEHGFYHASRHHGVVYSPFNDYWLARIDGFRRVPLPVTAITD